MTRMTKFDFTIPTIIMISLLTLAPLANAAGCCSGGTWDPSGFLNSDPGSELSSQPTQPVQSSQTVASAQADGSEESAATGSNSTQDAPDRLASYPNDSIMKSMKSVSSSDVVVDASSKDSYAKSHIKNAIHIPSQDLLDSNGNLKSDEELSRLLGEAGISREDSVVVYGSAESSGEAELAFLVLRYLGQEDVKLLDGSLEEWKAAGLPVEAQETVIPAAEYNLSIRPGVIADYDYVNSSQAQIVDVRPFVDFGKGRINGSIALDPANVIKGDKIKNGGDLATVFSRLDKDMPIVVYSDDYSRSALVAYSLQLMNYKAAVYSWEDWQAHEGEGTDEGDNSKYVKLGKN